MLPLSRYSKKREYMNICLDDKVVCGGSLVEIQLTLSFLCHFNACFVWFLGVRYRKTFTNAIGWSSTSSSWGETFSVRGSVFSTQLRHHNQSRHSCPWNRWHTFFMTIYSGYNNCYKSALGYRHFWKYPKSSLSDTLDKYTLKDMCWAR